MLFERRLREGLHDGSISMAFRRWQRRQVVSGGRYRTGLDMVQVDSVAVVDPAESLGLEKAVFKRSVRNLEGMGLTLSLRAGYRLSPRGEAYLRLSGRAVSASGA
jgi:hypothetical protein